MDTAYDPAWLTKAMAETGFGVSELANAAGVSRSQIQRIRNGMPPRMDTQAKLRAALATKAQIAA
jgi:transcriptional regulator with XRE-family HTH domain